MRFWRVRLHSKNKVNIEKISCRIMKVRYLKISQITTGIYRKNIPLNKLSQELCFINYILIDESLILFHIIWFRRVYQCF